MTAWWSNFERGPAGCACRADWLARTRNRCAAFGNAEAGTDASARVCLGGDFPGCFSGILGVWRRIVVSVPAIPMLEINIIIIIKPT